MGYGGYDDGGYGGSGGDSSSKGDRIAASLGDYNTIPERLAEFREKHPEGSLQPLDLSEPVKLRQIGERYFLEYVAAAYRTPDDPRPGIGVAWEKFPGTTPFTKDSEAMNAETSAWGRAIVAALAADAKKGIATDQEIRNRQAERRQADDQNRPEPQLDKLNSSIDLLYAATNKQEMATAWRMAGSFWLLDAEIPGRDAGFLYRHLWKERMDLLNEEAAKAAGLGEETGEPAVAPGEEAQAPADADEDMTAAATEVIADQLGGEVIEQQVDHIKSSEPDLGHGDH